MIARATDVFGTSADSKPAQFTVSNAVPVVTLTSPANLAVFHAGANITLAADATDTDDAVAKVGFYAGDKLLGTATNKPFSLVWSNIAPGNYSIFARATDVGGASGTSKRAEISVTNGIPVIRLLGPTNGAVFAYPANITLTADASDTDGAIAKVSFYAGDKLLGSRTNQPYSLIWTNVPLGQYSLVARAFDQFGVAGVSAVSKIIVSNSVPVVSFVTPANGALFGAPANIAIAVAASDPDGIAKVTLYAGDRILGTFTNAPYSLVWSNAAGGTYVLTARAVDGVGQTASAQVKISVSRAVPPVTNALPVVRLTSPTNGAVFGVSANIQVAAEATNANNSITRVSFYANDRLLGTVTNQPYSLTWSNPAPGSYSLFARATDALDKYAYSTAIRIQVTNAAPTVSLTSPTNNASFVAPAQIVLAAQAADVDDSVIRVATI